MEESKKKTFGYVTRILYKFYLKLKDKFDTGPKITDEEKYCVQICLKLLENSSSKLTFAPVSSTRFIVNEDKGMAITIENRVVHIINHVYSYSIYMENNECYSKILKKFDDISEKKKNELEVKLTNNIKHSLKKILEGLS